MQIRLVNDDEKNQVLSLYRQCAGKHQKEGFNQWDTSYPNSQTILQDIKEKSLFGLYIKKSLVAIISITNQEPVEYLSVDWKENRKKYLIIHRLCVSNNSLRRGYAKFLMLFAEKYAVKNQFNSIRLDTFSLNKIALKFYRSIGYTEVGRVEFAKRKDSDYTCFEKILNENTKELK